MSLPESDVQALAFALIDDALKDEDEYTNEINIDQLRNMLVKHKVIVENLTTRYISFRYKFLYPPSPPQHLTEPICRILTETVGKCFETDEVQNKILLYSN